MLSEPAVGKTFFGREEVLRVLEKRVHALKGGYRQNVALTGQMLSGKSSILYQFLYTLKDSSLIPIYIEVMKEPFSVFVDKFIATLLFSYFASSGHPKEKNLDDLTEFAEEAIPHTAYAIKKVKQDISRKNYHAAYKKLLDLTSVLKKETGKSCVVILDEFHNLEFFKIRKPYLHFGKIMMIQKDTMYIVSSSQKSAIKKILSEKLALLFGNFEIVEVSGFDDKTAEAFLKEKFQGIETHAAYMDYLIDFTDGNPFYLDVISKKIIEILNSGKSIAFEEPVIVEALASLLYKTSGTINQYFTNTILNLLEKSLREDCLEVLMALASGCNKLSDIAKWLNRKSKSGIADKLSELIGSDMVYKSGVFYEVQDKVFSFWMRAVYHKKKTSLVNDILSKADEFKKEALANIRGYFAESRKTVFDRIKELFGLFNGETVEIGKRNRKLPKFAKIEIRKYGKSDDLVAYQAPDKYWVSEICEHKIDELAVADFIERHRALAHKKIYIALGGIDENALLLAKEKNIWVWGLENINGILRLYKKHNLIQKENTL